MLKITLNIVFFISFLSFINAQDTTEVNEIITRRELDMKTYPPDTSATAVVLFDFGELTMSYNSQFLLNRKRLIKILKPSGVNSHGTFKLTLDVNYQTLQSLQARVIQPDSSVIKLKPTDIFIEKINEDRLTVKIAFPDIQVGSILEVNYFLYSTSIDMVKWSFQEDIPIRRNMLLIDLPNYIKFEYLYKGLIDYKLAYAEQNRLFRSNVKIPVLIMDTVPAFQLEPFMPAVKDVSCSLGFNWKQIELPNSKKVVVNDWNFMNKAFLEHKKFGSQYRKKSNYGDVWKVIKPLLAQAASTEDSLKVVYDYISKNIVWIDDFFSPFVEKTLETAFKKKKANSGEMNLMIVACLAEAGMSASPLLISTFENGTPSQNYSSPYQFDHVLCYVTANGKEYFLDAGNNTSRNIYLPRRVSINTYGWLVNEDNPRWVNLPHPLSHTTTEGSFKLEKNGDLSCNLNTHFVGYAAVDERDNIKKDSLKEFVKKGFSNDYTDIEFKNIEFDSIENLYTPLIRHIECNIKEAASSSDSLLYLTPPLFGMPKQSPFKEGKRSHLIVFNYPIKDEYSLNITIPDGYVVESLPTNTSSILGKNEATFNLYCNQVENTIQIRALFHIATLYYHFNRYSEIKAFFDNISSKCNEQIVLKKKK